MSAKMCIKNGNWYLAEVSGEVHPVWSLNKDEACIIEDPKLCQMLIGLISQSMCSTRVTAVTADPDTEETEYFSYPRTKIYEAPHIVNDYKSSVYLDCLNEEDVLFNFCGIDWLVVDRRFIKDRNVVQVTFMPNVIDSTLVPWDVPTIKDGHIIKSEMKYDESFVASLCSDLYKIIKERMEGNKLVTLVPDPETKHVVHLPTFDQMKGGYSYFSSQNNRRCCDTDDEIASYWTASLDRTGYVWLVNSDGCLGSSSSPSNALGFRPAFTLEFPDSRKKEETE